MQTQAKGTGRFFVGGNWKANGSLETVKTLVQELNQGRVDSEVETVCAPPFLYIQSVKETLKEPFKVSAQNCWIAGTGAYTGEVCAEMLVDMGIEWVILGHSERRALCHESNDIVGQKEAYALSKGLNVIGCIGESLEERENGRTLQVIYEQLEAMKKHISKWNKVVIAYEPIWAIGTGKVATPQQAQEVHAGIREWLKSRISQDVASSMRIIYGGSVKGSNCEELAKEEDIDGFLVGGASLSGPEFLTICNSVSAKKSTV